MRRLLHMWRYPRMVSWYLAATLLFLLARLPFAKVPIIPYYIEFQPGIVLVPLAGVFWGPAGALGILTASLLGDWAVGLWGPLSAFRAMGLFLSAYSSKLLWDYAMRHIGKQGGLTPHWGRTVRFLYIAWPGCMVAASWQALGTDMLRLYPFPYVLALLMANHLLFTTLLGPALYRIMAREVVPHFGCWRQVMSNHAAPPLSTRGVLLHLTGALGVCAVGLALAGTVYGMWPYQRYFLGDATGPFLHVCLAPFFVLQVAGMLLLQKTAAHEEDPARARQSNEFPSAGGHGGRR